jgi:hypothetical protein
VYPRLVPVPVNRNDQRQPAPIMTKPQAFFEVREFININFLRRSFCAIAHGLFRLCASALARPIAD